MKKTLKVFSGKHLNYFIEKSTLMGIAYPMGVKMYAHLLNRFGDL
jgi:hypothetical protein